MKIRTGFVTNSSSSSFTLILKIDRKNGKPLVWKGYGYEDSDRFGNKYRELNAAISPKKLARSSDTAALAEALKKAVTTIQRTENGDWEDVQVLDDTTKFIKDIKKFFIHHHLTNLYQKVLEIKCFQPLLSILY